MIPISLNNVGNDLRVLTHVLLTATILTPPLLREACVVCAGHYLASCLAACPSSGGSSPSPSPCPFPFPCPSPCLAFPWGQIPSPCSCPCSPSPPAHVPLFHIACVLWCALLLMEMMKFSTGCCPHAHAHAPHPHLQMPVFYSTASALLSVLHSVVTVSLSMATFEALQSAMICIMRHRHH